jgi:hypothetical protein
MKIKVISLEEINNDIPNNPIKIENLKEYLEGGSVEGAELKVIKGGIETLKKCKLVIIECHYDEDWMDISQFLIDNNLQFRNLLNDEVVTYGEYRPIPGRSSIGRPYQMYLIQ